MASSSAGRRSSRRVVPGSGQVSTLSGSPSTVSRASAAPGSHHDLVRATLLERPHGVSGSSNSSGGSRLDSLKTPVEGYVCSAWSPESAWGSHHTRGDVIKGDAAGYRVSPSNSVCNYDAVSDGDPSNMSFGGGSRRNSSSPHDYYYPANYLESSSNVNGVGPDERPRCHLTMSGPDSAAGPLLAVSRRRISGRDLYDDEDRASGDSRRGSTSALMPINSPPHLSEYPISPLGLPFPPLAYDLLNLSESELVRDLIFALQGLDGQYVYFEPAIDSYVLSPRIRASDALRCMVTRVAYIGAVYLRLKAALDDSTSGDGLAAGHDENADVLKDADNRGSHSLVLEAFKHCVREPLTDYYTMIAMLEAEAAKSNANWYYAGNSLQGTYSRRQGSQRLSHRRICSLLVWRSE
eukprot:GHVT01029287.1.p1 GENE.GHVT01029287.1~~GHVT01029287.1.p1  ORF type:complete len:408 (+),score=52.06 GHVT01029287.1:561-1784(+)